MAAKRWRRLVGIFGVGVDGSRIFSQIVRITQIPVESLHASTTGPIRFSQAPVEGVRRSTTGPIRFTQLPVEVLKTFTCAPPPTPTTPVPACPPDVNPDVTTNACAPADANAAPSSPGCDSPGAVPPNW